MGDYEAQSWPKDTSSARRSRLSRDLALRMVTDIPTTTWTSREHIIPTVHLAQVIDDDLEKGRKGMIHVQNDVTLEVENARGSRCDYPVWDWTGNHDYVSATDIAGGRMGIGMAK